MDDQQRADRYTREYAAASAALRQLYSGQPSRARGGEALAWSELLFGTSEPPARTPQANRIHSLARQVRQRRAILLNYLGQDNEADWLAAQGILSNAADFWKSYLRLLGRRGITTFTTEQVGPGSDVWLRPGHDLLVIIPTGAGKSIIGELRSALALAQGTQVLWMLPTRALVRQTKRELRRALEPLKVSVEELPTTEDFSPLFADKLPRSRYVAATTPEKLEALLHANPSAIARIGLVVLDEAHLLWFSPVADSRPARRLPN